MTKITLANITIILHHQHTVASKTFRSGRCYYYYYWKLFLPSLFQLIPGSVFKVKRQGHLSDFALNVNETVVSLITGMNSWVFFSFFLFFFFWGSMFHTVTLTVMHNSYRRRTLLVWPIVFSFTANMFTTNINGVLSETAINTY